jgi:tetratricopeptide (TPR) repeat protein
MNLGILIRVCILGLVILALIGIWHAIQDANDGIKLIYFLVVGVGGGLWAMKVFIPWIGDTIGTFFYSSGEEIQMDDKARAAVKLAQGDYLGAIQEFEKLAIAHPEAPHPVGEIAKIYSDRLHAADKALETVQTHLESREWPIDEAAFLMFRLAEIHSNHLHDHDAALDILRQVISNFPNTRHSANANHRIHEVEQAQFKQVMEQRLKSSGNA